jgi:IS1 family transposase
MPPVYRQSAVIYTDHWSAYDSVLPSKRHYSVDKDSGCTSYIERFNCTIRQGVSRVGEKELIQLLEIGKSSGCNLEFCASL